MSQRPMTVNLECLGVSDDANRLVGSEFLEWDRRQLVAAGGRIQFGEHLYTSRPTSGVDDRTTAFSGDD